MQHSWKRLQNGHSPRNSKTVTPILLKIEPFLPFLNTNKTRYQALYVLPELSYHRHRVTESQKNRRTKSYFRQNRRKLQNQVTETYFFIKITQRMIRKSEKTISLSLSKSRNRKKVSLKRPLFLRESNTWPNFIRTEVKKYNVHIE